MSSYPSSCGALDASPGKRALAESGSQLSEALASIHWARRPGTCCRLESMGKREGKGWLENRSEGRCGNVVDPIRRNNNCSQYNEEVGIGTFDVDRLDSKNSNQ